MSKLSDSMREFLNGCHYATLATLNEDGSIHLTPVWYLFEDECFFVSTAAASDRKVKNILARPAGFPRGRQPAQARVRTVGECVGDGGDHPWRAVHRDRRENSAAVSNKSRAGGSEGGSSVCSSGRSDHSSHATVVAIVGTQERRRSIFWWYLGTDAGAVVSSCRLTPDSLVTGAQPT